MDTRRNLSFALLAVGGLAFIAGGASHPRDSGSGTKTEQLRDMLVQTSWYPSHALLLLGTVGFAVGAAALRERGTRATRTVARTATVVGAVAVVGMAAHLLEALNADALADGEANLFAHVQVVNETVVATTWGLAFAALALVGGVGRSIGNPVTAALGVVGGATYALASATIAFTDTFDSLFPVGTLLGTWAIWVGVSEARADAKTPASV